PASPVFSQRSGVPLVASAQAPGWSWVAAGATRLLQEYVRLDTSNPPGDTRQAADFLTAILERDGVRVTRYESAPGKALVLARLRATIAPPARKPLPLRQPMAVVPADPSRSSAAP